MEKIKVEMEVPKEAHELFKGLFKIVLAIKVALEDGWNPAEDMPTIVTQSLIELGPMVQGCDKLPHEFKNDPAGFIKAAIICSGDIAAIFANIR